MILLTCNLVVRPERKHIQINIMSAVKTFFHLIEIETTVSCTNPTKVFKKYALKIFFTIYFSFSRIFILLLLLLLYFYKWYKWNTELITK